MAARRIGLFLPALLLAASCARERPLPISVRRGKRLGPLDVRVTAPRHARPRRPFLVTTDVSAASAAPLAGTIEWILPKGIEMAGGAIRSAYRVPALGRISRSVRLRAEPGARGTIVLRARARAGARAWVREVYLQVGDPMPLPPPYELADGRRLRIP